MVTKYFNFTLIDGNGGEPVQNATLFVADGKIVDACEAENEVDLQGKWVIPGLMDGHVHYTGLIPKIEQGEFNLDNYNVVDKTVWTIRNLEFALKEGLTTVRDVGSFDVFPLEFTLKNYLKNGFIKGPNYFCSGNPITMTGGHAAHMTKYICDGPEETRKATRELISQGADLVKAMGTGGVTTEGNDPNAYQLNVDELSAIAHEIHKVGKKAAVHVHGAQGIKNAVMAGFDTIEHGTLADDESIQMMADNGCYLVPTFAVKYMILTDPRVPEFMKAKEKIMEEAHNKSFKKAYEAGVKIACGTDLTPTMMEFAVATEVALMIQVTGMSNLEGIQIATKNTADMIGILDTHGTLEVGKVADFVVLGGDPIADIANLKQIVSVYHDGILA